MLWQNLQITAHCTLEIQMYFPVTWSFCSYRLVWLLQAASPRYQMMAGVQGAALRCCGVKCSCFLSAFKAVLGRNDVIPPLSVWLLWTGGWALTGDEEIILAVFLNTKNPRLVWCCDKLTGLSQVHEWLCWNEMLNLCLVSEALVSVPPPWGSPTSLSGLKGLRPCIWEHHLRSF